MSADELHAEEDVQIAALSAAGAASAADGATDQRFARERQLLEEMSEIAEASRALRDARIERLVAWIREHQCPRLPSLGKRATAAATWNDTRIIIFTEYEDTKRYLHQQLAAAIEGTDRSDERIAVFAGSTPERSALDGGVPSREAIKQAFNAEPSKHPLRILIATDAAREGLNLQAHCWNLFHFDVPWNPSRMEQRNGRIDRKLQPRDDVYCHYFVYRQRPEDRILSVLVRKTETIKRELGSLAQVIDARLAERLKAGIRRDAIDALEREIDGAELDPLRRQVVEEELEATRQRQQALRKQIDALRGLLENSKDTIGLDEKHFRAAISSALAMLGAEPLTAISLGTGSFFPQTADRLDGAEKPGLAEPPGKMCLSPSLDVSGYAFPALDQRDGADPSWADTMDTLRAPRQRGQKPWEWRRESPIRPVVFEDPGTLTDEVVHLHLEHRVVQRLLGRFIAQGFVYHDLSRACLTQTTDAIPRVVLLGRLCLYGPNAARLHEELVPVTARWTDPAIRKVPLTPYARDSQTKTLALLDEALVSGVHRGVSQQILKQLQASAGHDVQELLPHLQSRGEEYAADARARLTERGLAESSAMRIILQTQQKHLAETVAHHDRADARQRLLEFGDAQDELRQLEANRRHWQIRLAALDRELATEPERIRELYEVRATRIEPVGLVYLWPKSS